MAVLEKKIAVGNVIARDVTFENYMKYFAQHFAEWVEGTVIKMSPVAREHDLLDGFLYRLLSHYLEETGEGLLMRAPFVMRISPQSPAREPDLHVVVKTRAEIVQRTMTAGPADIAIEIVSEDSEEHDKEEKRTEYEAGGVREYWIFDPLKNESRFYFLNSEGKFEPIVVQGGIFRSRVLPRFQLDTRILWQEPLPTGRQIVAMVDEMLKEGG